MTFWWREWKGKCVDTICRRARGKSDESHYKTSGRWRRWKADKDAEHHPGQHHVCERSKAWLSNAVGKQSKPLQVWTWQEQKHIEREGEGKKTSEEEWWQLHNGKCLNGSCSEENGDRGQVREITNGEWGILRYTGSGWCKWRTGSDVTMWESQSSAKGQEKFQLHMNTTANCRKSPFLEKEYQRCSIKIIYLLWTHSNSIRLVFLVNTLGCCY